MTCCGCKLAARREMLAVASVVTPPVAAAPVAVALHAEPTGLAIVADLAAHAFPIVPLETLIACKAFVALDLTVPGKPLAITFELSVLRKPLPVTLEAPVL